jgi:tetratricopeptide (TPR) repeat protein
MTALIRSLRFLPAAAILAASSATPVAAQVAALSDVAPTVAEQADRVHLAGRPAEALSLLEAHLQDSPDDYRARWMACRAALAVGVLAQKTPDVRDAWIDRAVAHGEAAVLLAPTGVDGRYWRLASKGRKSLHAGARTTARLAQEVWDEAHELLELDSLHAGAHNALGRLNLEVMSLAGWKRAIARVLVGGALKRTSWENAESFLTRASELAPDVALYHRDLGALYRRRGEPTRARPPLERAAALPVGEPWEAYFQEEARAMLTNLERYVGDAAEGADTEEGTSPRAPGPWGGAPT